MYRRDIIDGIQVSARDFDFLEEILIKAHDEGWRIKEVPFQFMVRGSGRSHIRLLRFGLAFLKTLLRLWRLRNSLACADYDWRAFNSPIWLQRYWQRARHRIVLGYLDSNDEILDIGCGSSRIIMDLSEAVGLDLLFNKLRWLKPRHKSVVQADGCFLPFREHAFSTVICSELIEHVPDRTELWSEMWRVLRPGGILILGTPDYGRPLWLLLEKLYGLVLPDAYAGDHITHYQRKSLERRMRDYGYDVLDCRYVGGCEMIFKLRKPSGELTPSAQLVRGSVDPGLSLPLRPRL
jgi:SAM-dependent methyltransferase